MAGLPANAHYREAQRLLLPAGVVWTDREAYDERMELFQRISKKLYAGERMEAVPAPVVAATEPPRGGRPRAAASRGAVVRRLSIGLAFLSRAGRRVVQEFADYDGQQIHAGEVLHFMDSSYFFCLVGGICG